MCCVLLLCCAHSGAAQLQGSEGSASLQVCDECPEVELEYQTIKLSIEVEPGMEHGHSITLYGEGEPHPDGEAGDLIVQLVLKPHGLFKRDKAHLRLTQRISLADALAGFRHEVEHLDGHKVCSMPAPAFVCASCFLSASCFAHGLRGLLQVLHASGAHSLEHLRAAEGGACEQAGCFFFYVACTGMHMFLALTPRFACKFIAWLQVVLQQSGVTEHGMTHRIKGEGMPLFGNSARKGELIVTYSVKFPKQLSSEQKDGLRKLLEGAE